MNDSMIVEALSFLRSFAQERTTLGPQRIDEETRNPSAEEALAHLLYMLDKMPTFLADADRERFMRWLGFAQGVAFMTGISLHELKEMNRPAGQPYDSSV